MPPPAARPMRIVAAEAVLEDGGKPASRPDFVYDGSCYASARGSSSPCVVRVFLKGFRRAVAPVDSNGKTTVVLRRLGADGEAFPKQMVDLGALRLPPAAHHAYAKGEAAMGLRHLPEAERWFRIAVKEYPGHALAWDELGLVLEQLGKPQEASAAYLRSLEADPRLARPLVHLAGLAINAQNWEEAASLTARALDFAPASFPRAWYYDALASFDSEHAFPAADYVLGMALAGRGDPDGASEHLRAYLKLAPRGHFAETARQRLAEIDEAQR